MVQSVRQHDVGRGSFRIPTLPASQKWRHDEHCLLFQDRWKKECVETRGPAPSPVGSVTRHVATLFKLSFVFERGASELDAFFRITLLRVLAYDKRESCRWLSAAIGAAAQRDVLPRSRRVEETARTSCRSHESFTDARRSFFNTLALGHSLTAA